MIPEIKSDGSEYYDYVLMYIDDALVIIENCEYVLTKHIENYFELKEEFIGPPEIYLGGSLSNIYIENGVKEEVFGSTQYFRAAVENLEGYLKEKNIKLPVKCETPIADFIVAYCSAHKLGKWKIVEVDVGANHGTVYFGL